MSEICLEGFTDLARFCKVLVAFSGCFQVDMVGRVEEHMGQPTRRPRGVKQHGMCRATTRSLLLLVRENVSWEGWPERQVGAACEDPPLPQ